MLEETKYGVPFRLGFMLFVCNAIGGNYMLCVGTSISGLLQSHVPRLEQVFLPFQGSTIRPTCKKENLNFLTKGVEILVSIFLFNTA